MPPRNPVTVEVDVTRNVVSLSFSGVIRATDMPRYADEIARALKSVNPGFTLLTDLTDLAKMELGCVPPLEQTMDLARDRGVKLVVRIIPDRSKDIGMSILSLFHYPRNLRIVTTETRAEAAQVLPKRPLPRQPAL